MAPDDRFLLPRSFDRRYRTAVRGEGVYLFDDLGRRYLDCGSAAVVTIGHGVPEVVEAIRAQAAELAYVHSSQFHTRPGMELARLLADRYPGAPQQARVFFTSGGSEAVETAIKITRQYWRARGRSDRYRILSRRQSYHGATLGALAASGPSLRRSPFEPLLPESRHVAPCFCYRCPFQREYPACELACAHDLDDRLRGPDGPTAAGVIVEPIVGATTGAVPPDGYLAELEGICRQHDVLLIADETLTGAGRTGRFFAMDHWSIQPDLVVLGKGLSSGYAPLGAVVVAERVWRAIERAAIPLGHGFTYSAHPISVAAGLAVQRYLETHDLVRHAAERGEQLAARLASLDRHVQVGDIRGRGLLQTVEFVADRQRREPFDPSVRFSERLYQVLFERGVLVYPMTGTADGARGDHVMIVPPFTIEPAHIDSLVDELDRAIGAVAGILAHQR